MHSSADLSRVGDDELAGKPTGGDVCLRFGGGGVAFVEAEAYRPGTVGLSVEALLCVFRKPGLKSGSGFVFAVIVVHW